MKKSSTGCGCLFVLLAAVICIGIVTIVTSKAKQEALAQGDKLYTEGKVAEAVAKYKEGYAVAGDRKVEIIKRIVEHEANNGSADEAIKWIEKGLDDKLALAFDDATAQALLAKVQQEREARLAQKQAEEEERKKATRAEAARKTEEEIDADGLVLLRKTVEGKGGIGGEITGTVVNRRDRKLSYAQITFNLYDKSGAQVGNAFANINGLEPGGRWKFKATTFGKDFHTYKFFELSGF